MQTKDSQSPFYFRKTAIATLVAGMFTGQALAAQNELNPDPNQGATITSNADGIGLDEDILFVDNGALIYSGGSSQTTIQSTGTNNYIRVDGSATTLSNSGNVQLIIDNDNGGAGALIITDENGGEAPVNVITSNNLTTTITDGSGHILSVGPSGTAISGGLTANGGATLNSALNGNSLSVGNGGTSVTGTLTSSGLASFNGGATVSSGAFAANAGGTLNSAQGGNSLSVGNGGTSVTGAFTSGGPAVFNGLATFNNGATISSGAFTANAGGTLNNGAALYSGSGTGNSVVVSGSGTEVTGNLTATGASNTIGTAGSSANTLTGSSNTLTSTDANTLTGFTNTLTSTSANTIETTGGGSLSTTTTSATLRGAGTLATNGATGTTSNVGAGGITVYNSAQAVASGSTINNALNGREYQTLVNGNMLVDGNVLINGTLDFVSSDSTTTTVVGGPETSNLDGASQGTSGGTVIVMKGSSGVPESVAALTLTNGVGNTHGIEVYENRTVLSGGVTSTTMTLNDNGATFSNTRTGGPARVTGVADGKNDFDAVNFRQMKTAYAGIASVAAMSSLPAPMPGKQYSVGVGVGHFESENAIAVGFKALMSDAVSLNVGLGHSNDATAASAGLGFSW